MKFSRHSKVVAASTVRCFGFVWDFFPMFSAVFSNDLHLNGTAAALLQHW